MRHVDLQRLHPNDTACEETRLPFAEANYLTDATLFRRLQAITLAGRAYAAVVDLEQPAQVTQVVSQLTETGPLLGVLDLSNAWEFLYLGHEATWRIVQQFDSVADAHSHLLLTKLVRFEESILNNATFYYGIPFGHLRTLTPKDFAELLLFDLTAADSPGAKIID